MIAFVQPFGIESPGGGARILRRLLEDAPAPCMSVCTALTPPTSKPKVDEVHLPLRFGVDLLERRFSHQLWGLHRSRLMSPLRQRQSARFEDRLAEILKARRATAVHAVAHGSTFWHASRVARRLRLPFYLTIHDDLPYNLQPSSRWYLEHMMGCLGQAWTHASGRIVISEAMGEEYARRFGRLPYEVVTDGLTEIANSPRPRSGGDLRLYLTGSIHVSYEPNFRVLLEALDRIKALYPNIEVSLTTRGGCPFSLEGRGVPVRVMPWGSEEDIANDLSEADMLYLPLPFQSKHDSFVRYSLSTKMVTYLGSGLPVIYHGPGHAAAADLLRQHGAAVMAESLDASAMIPLLLKARDEGEALVKRALGLGRARFDMEAQRGKFWRVLGIRSIAAAEGHCPVPNRTISTV